MSETKNIINLDLFTAVEIEINSDDKVQLFHQRVNDGYINATKLCKNAGKRFNDWYRLNTTTPFLEELAIVAGIPATELIHIIKGGDYKLQGTWVHPQVAINLAQWLSPKFAVQVSKWVLDWMSGNIPQKSLPYHLERYVANMHKIPQGYFSILNEMSQNLIAPLENQGYTLPANMLPDISQGRMFSEWIRKEKNLEPKSFPKYMHEYSDGRLVEARLYPNKLLEDFRNHFYNTWIKKKSRDYFEKRDLKAVPFLDSVISLLEGTKVEPFKIKEIEKTKDNSLEKKENKKIVDSILGDNPNLDNPNFEKKLEKISLKNNQ